MTPNQRVLPMTDVEKYTANTATSVELSNFVKRMRKKNPRKGRTRNRVSTQNHVMRTLTLRKMMRIILTTRMIPMVKIMRIILTTRMIPMMKMMRIILTTRMIPRGQTERASNAFISIQ